MNEAMEALQDALQQNKGRAELVSPRGPIGWVQVKEDHIVVTNNGCEHRTVASIDGVPTAMQELGLPTDSPFWR